MAWQYSLETLARVIGSDAVCSKALFSSVSTDSRNAGAGQVFFALKGERFDGNEYVEQALASGAVAAVTSAPGPGARLVVREPLEALQRFAAWHRAQYGIPVIALTGSCGKTSTKEYLAALLETKYQVVKTRGNLNNEIGCPLSLLQIGADTEVAVIEMGANHRGEIARLCAMAGPTESAVTMVGAAHLEGFGSIENVAAAKAEIVEGLDSGGVFYMNTDDPWCLGMEERCAGRIVRFGSGGTVRLNACADDGEGEMLLDITPAGRLRLPLLVRAQVSNILLAVAAGLEHGVTEFEAPLRRACGGSSRMRVVKAGPLEVLDDTYNANPASMAAALEALSNRSCRGVRMAALGEMLELGGAAAELHRQVGALAAQAGITHFFVRGPHACDMIEAAKACGVPHAEVVEDHQTIAEAIHSLARPGDLLLLKGSRGMRMERVLEFLQARYATAAAPPHQ